MKCVIVDDDPEWLQCVERTLGQSKTGFKVVAFTRGLDALEHLHRHPTDAIITDLIMPELHGFLLIDAVRQFDPAIPIVLISMDESLEAESLASGANAYVPKSALNTRLVRTLQRLTEHATVAAR